MTLPVVGKQIRLLVAASKSQLHGSEKMVSAQVKATSEWVDKWLTVCESSSIRCQTSDVCNQSARRNINLTGTWNDPHVEIEGWEMPERTTCALIAKKLHRCVTLWNQLFVHRMACIQKPSKSQSCGVAQDANALLFHKQCMWPALLGALTDIPMDPVLYQVGSSWTSGRMVQAVRLILEWSWG